MTNSGVLHELLVHTQECATTPAMVGSQQILVLLRGIEIEGLRDRKFHSHGYTFVKVFADNHEVLKTDISMVERTPGWFFKKPQAFPIFLSSVIRLCLFRHHRHKQVDEPIAQLEGTAWTFVSEADARHKLDSEDSPGATMQVHMSIDSIDNKDKHFADHADTIANQQHRLTILARQREGRKASGGVVRSALPGLVNGAMGHLEALTNTLDHLAPAIPLSKIVVVLLRSVQVMMKAQSDVDAAVEDMLKTLHETLEKASNGDVDATKKQAVKLVGDCSMVLDKWIHERAAKQFVKAIYVQDRIKALHDQVDEFKTRYRLDEDQPEQKAAPANKKWTYEPLSDSPPSSPSPPPAYKESGYGEWEVLEDKVVGVTRRSEKRYAIVELEDEFECLPYLAKDAGVPFNRAESVY